jgi:hypothetical protein
MLDIAARAVPGALRMIPVSKHEIPTVLAHGLLVCDSAIVAGKLARARTGETANAAKLVALTAAAAPNTVSQMQEGGELFFLPVAIAFLVMPWAWGPSAPFAFSRPVKVLSRSSLSLFQASSQPAFQDRVFHVWHYVLPCVFSCVFDPTIVRLGCAQSALG